MGPRLGENTEEVLRQFGFAETEIANLIAAKAVTQNKVAHS